MPPLEFPGGARFAFTIIDDTDVATRDNVEPFYRLLHSLGMRTTKTAWPLDCPEGSKNFFLSETLEDPSYREFVLGLQDKGFEIGWHGATMESSVRERTLAGLERFRELFGHYPAIGANHSYNRENVYWGSGRIDNPLLAEVYARATGSRADNFEGHVEGSPYWWGDLCGQHMRYMRNLTFNEVNLLRINPGMPYRDPKRPLVRWWFSATDAEDATEFNELLRTENQERLEAERGICIVATHCGKGFSSGGEVHPETRARLEELSGRPGWFPPVGELLDWLRQTGRGEPVPKREWARMQRRWLADLAVRRWNRRRR